jgi:hypothetical protein
MNTRIGIVFALLAFLAGAVPAMANDIYIAQSAVGGANGADCADAFPVNFFNTAGNWGSAAGQIGPGTTVHLCGTITFPGGQTGLKIQRSGTAGSPIIVKFESNAILTAPYFSTNDFNSDCNSACGGAIDTNGQSYLIIDGGTNGIIEATASGSALTYHLGGVGISVYSSNVIVRNLTIENIYVNNGSTKYPGDNGSGSACPSGSSAAGCDQGGVNSADIRVSNEATNITICNNSLSDARMAILATTGDSGSTQVTNCASNTFGTGVNVFLNTTSDAAWQIGVQGYGRPNYYANDIGGSTGAINWQFPYNTYHTDGFIVFNNDGSTLTPYIYNNFLHGDLGAGSPTAQLFCTPVAGGTSGGGEGCTLFNNVVIGVGYGLTNDSLAWFGNPSPGQTSGPNTVLNNTYVNGGYSNTLTGDSTTIYTFENNIITNTYSFFYFNDAASQPFSTITVDHNLYGTATSAGWNWGGTNTQTFAKWKSNCISGGGTGCETNSQNINPALSASYLPTSSTPQIGANLTPLCSGQLAPLCYDKPVTVGVGGSTTGNPRPTTGAWPVGAYLAGNGVQPPSNVIATVQ